MSSLRSFEDEPTDASLGYQTRRANLLADMIRLFSSKLSIDEILEKVAEKSTEVLGDAAFIVLSSEGRLRLQTAHCADRERLVRMLIGAWNAEPSSNAGKALYRLLEGGDGVHIESLQHHPIGMEMRPLVDQCRLASLIAAPIRVAGKATGVFISVSSGSHILKTDEFALGTVLSDFAGAAMDYARVLEELEQSSRQDSLTGVYNSRFFHDTLEREAARAQRYGTGLSLLMVDVDCVETINDTAGPFAGDKLLGHVAGVLRQTVRNTDFVCRSSEDEFGIVLPGTELQGAQRVGQKIVEKVRTNQVLLSLGIRGPITVRVGAAEYQKGSDLETLVNNAAQALR